MNISPSSRECVWLFLYLIKYILLSSHTIHDKSQFLGLYERGMPIQLALSFSTSNFKYLNLKTLKIKRQQSDGEVCYVLCYEV